MGEFGFCDRCGEELFGGSHYHCGNCTSTDETSYMGHYTKDFVDGKPVGDWYFRCKPEDIVAHNTRDSSSAHEPEMEVYSTGIYTYNVEDDAYYQVTPPIGDAFNTRDPNGGDAQ